MMSAKKKLILKNNSLSEFLIFKKINLKLLYTFNKLDALCFTVKN